ncbi:DUF2993 domain-containing protein [Streptomyces sp. NPDC006692]|uniref:LmeA family phospholipid-binding protein n=1 Tax=Streptomyces sp. NPDC006692 TaxID=3364758 RepID=UPI0036780AE8
MRRRWVRILAITVGVLAVLFTAADRIAVHYADQEAGRLAKGAYGFTNAAMDVSIGGFPFLTQAAEGTLDHVSLTADKFYVSTTGNRQGDWLDIARLHLDLRDITVPSLTARSAQANLATGTLTLSYQDLSDLVTRLAGRGGSLQVSPAEGSDGQAARVKVTGTAGQTALNSTATLLAQGNELSLTVPGAERATAAWKVSLPEGVGFTAARSTPDGVEISLTGHQVVLGASRFSR